MFETTLINNVVLWERRLEIENERPKSHPFEPYHAFSAAGQPRRMTCKKMLEWRSTLNKEYQPVFCGIAQDCVYAIQS